MVDRADVEAVIYRAAFVAVRFGAPASDEQSQQDIAWCLEPLTTLGRTQRAELGALVLDLATDPTSSRETFVGMLMELVDE
ncbi:hypothetical protein G3N18_03940 [Microbacterium sp. 2C]|uniref:hypothetical protein n=1 Tax=Microbacterium paulum TaxID=2707006 RepID=UPI0018C1DECB|nr:hypothetical protein [Microbacterium paulum]MBG0717238.1 hypothetical protein [Microbacterium paulum]